MYLASRAFSSVRVLRNAAAIKTAAGGSTAQEVPVAAPPAPAAPVAFSKPAARTPQPKPPPSGGETSLRTIPIDQKQIPYFVHRSGTRNLPVYEEKKRGGNLLLTRVRKLEGDVSALRKDLVAALGLDQGKAYINHRTNAVLLKGHYGRKVCQFLEEKGF